MDLLYNIYYYSNLNNYINNYAFLELSSITINNNIFNIFNVFFFFYETFIKISTILITITI